LRSSLRKFDGNASTDGGVCYAAQYTLARAANATCERAHNCDRRLSLIEPPAPREKVKTVSRGAGDVCVGRWRRDASSSVFD
jgi:hypothetical protein